MRFMLKKNKELIYTAKIAAYEGNVAKCPHCGAEFLIDHTINYCPDCGRPVDDPYKEDDEEPITDED